ncbi:thermopsin [Sulfolobus acidocaldarius]|uniref:Conserved protein n=4 Tax=Sulfolobus acidocaldarius TaxID=2285 RepID=Q4J7S9_SULAC|nr:thermopsin [Sulfolobus acidocaldarius]AAY81152.1 conserved protein [Sulfolobus acidocaldarius DSM 639]AGE71763.1 hypothetical protein SacN8_09015 [Sulfolobus acidocaldarius N8]AGE74036.1 hypothetical protein SacRon12I_09035 [Sulfolobus acidocaldarius Ron12/I]ALU30035.1 hypothetical protein ATY89_08885 [Sulfolobus acidocaldarius]ALU30725.1 hypothetical protein ATZ20_00295 [Sulfolobus acidocaldarius]
MRKPLITFVLLFILFSLFAHPHVNIPVGSTTPGTVKTEILPNSEIPATPNVSLSWKYIPDYISVYSLHYSEPAPMGITDYGLSPNGSYILTTTQWMGVINLYGLSTNTTSVSFQLNLNLHYYLNGYTYDLWVQDVAFFDTQDNNIQILDNIWNFSSPHAYITSVQGNGNIYSYSKLNTTYYAYEASGYPGSPATLTLPATVYLLVNVSTNSLGEPVIYFYYNDGYGWILYDTVTVTNAQGSSQVYFLVDGFQYNGYGTFWDSEMVFAGPGGGSTTYVYSSEVYLELLYWNGHNFQEVENAYNFGSDTGESAENVIDSYYYYRYTGLPVAGLTAGSGSLGQLWNYDSVTILEINTPVQSGYATVYNFSIPFSDSSNIQDFYFTGGEFILTLFPMPYSILVYQNGQLAYEGYSPGDTGLNVVNTERFALNLSSGFIKLYTNQSYDEVINIIGEGPAYIYVNSSNGLSYSLSQEYLNLNGDGSVNLRIYPQSPGFYTVTVTVNLLNGYYLRATFSVYVQAISSVKFNINVVGSQLPTSPVLTLQFPNGTISTLTVSPGETLYLPVGTTYNLQQIIGSGNIRWASPSPINGIVNGSITIYVTYYQQYLVNFNFMVQGGSGYPAPQLIYTSFGQSYESTVPITVWVDSNSQYYFQNILQGDNERWVDFSPTGVISSPGNVIAFYYNEYYVTVKTPVTVYAYINGTKNTLSSGWYIQGTNISIINETYPVSNGVRIILSGISPALNFVINSPLVVTVTTVTQVYLTVNSILPVEALVNGTNVTLTTGWYNNGTKIQIENITRYTSTGERYILTSIYPSASFTLTSPVNITVTYQQQFRIIVNSQLPIYAIVNGENTSLTTGWYNNGTKIQIENITRYTSNDQRYVMIYISFESLTVDQPFNISANFIKQYYINVISPIPVKALVNGTLTSLNSSWVNSGTKIQVINYTYYVSNNERLVPTLIPSNLTVTSPITVEIKTVTQYLVTINGNSSWHNNGSTIVLNANIPFYMTGKYIGTYNVSPGAELVVNRPLVENLTETINLPVTIGIGALIIIVILGVVVTRVLLHKKRP